MSNIFIPIQQWFDRLFLLPTQRRLNNTHHFVCCGTVHVKFATLIIIIIKLAVTGFLSLHLLSNGVVVNHWIDVIYDIAEFITIIALIYGFIKEKSRWMLPYMAVQFSWFVIALIMTAITMLLFSGGLGIELSILLACNRYFDDQRYRIHEIRNRPIIRNVDGQVEHTVVDMDTVEFKNVLEQAKNQTGNVETNQNNSNNGFANPNFSLVDSEDEVDENNWHKKAKKSNILA
uniref:Uncharacterized protein n=2 Tax=Panagrolaimus sp. JU765 TaxID=591449 RepID=A0AC34Q8H7_9BILA